MGLTVRNGAPARAATPAYQLREAAYALTRAIEDQGWTNVTQDAAEPMANWEDRKALIRRARLYLRRNPLAKQAASLLVNYVLGQGISTTANNKKVIARVVDELMDNPTNRAAFTSQQSMAEFVVGAFSDGIQYLVLFPNTDDGTLELSTIDPLYVEDEIRDPENWRVAKWYRVHKPRQRYDFRNGQYDTERPDDFVYYRHWRNTDPVGGKGAPRKVEEGLIMPCRRGKGKFGESDMAAAVDWLKAHKEFMEDRATLSRAAATIAWKKKRKGAASDVKAEVDRLQTSLVKALNNGVETNPPPAAGSTLVENDLSDTEWMRTDTGGAAADFDERKLRMMAGSSMGVMNHYFGDEAQANLATATAMELPMLKNYEGWQKWLADILSDVIGFALEVAHEAERIGPRDDESKYADRSMAAQQVLAMPGAGPGSSARAPGDTSPTSTNLAEADVTVKVTSGGKSETKNVPDQAAQDQAAQQALQPQAMPDKFVTVVDQMGPEDKVDPNEPLDWYVDIDFPPIIQKDLGTFMIALESLSKLLPMGNPESVKLVIELALVAYNVNDVNQVLDRLFPPAQLGPDGKPVPEIVQTPLLGPGQMPQLPGGPRPGLLGPGQQPGPGQQQPVHEAIPMARQMTVLDAVRETALALEQLHQRAPN